MKSLVEEAAKRGAWVVFAGHDIGTKARQVTESAALEQFLKYAQDPANGVWLDTIEKVAKHIKARQSR
jgi:hypothetical protein